MKTFPLVFVLGPTAVGKSNWAVECIEERGGVILNCDSVQAYKGLDIGAAKPSRDVRQKIGHFLFDIVELGEVLTAGDYRRMALPVLERELPRHPVFAVGGSGFYIQALEKGMFEMEKVDPPKEAAIRARLDQIGLKAMFEELSRFDPEMAEELNPNDSYRIQRALIIYHGLGRKLSELKKEFRPKKLPYPVLKAGLRTSREELKKRVTLRAEEMLRAGLIDEVKALLNRGLGTWPLLQSVGYKQALMCLHGELPRENLLDEIVLRTMQLSKRQMTWFQRDKEIHWFDLTQAETAKQWLFHELDSVSKHPNN